MVYLSSEYSMIVTVYICDAPIQARAFQTLKTYRPHSFWWIQWRPLSLRKWESAIKPRQSSWSTCLLNIARLWEFTQLMLQFKHVLFKHKIPTALILSGGYSGGLCLSENENQTFSRSSSDYLLDCEYSTIMGVYISDAQIQTRAV